MKTKEQIDQIAQSLRNLAHLYSHELAQLESAVWTLSKDLAMEELKPSAISGRRPHPSGLLVADRSLLAITWRGKMCVLDNTIASATP